MKLITASALTLALAAGGTLVVAGPLNPPAGPVAPTFKTLADVEPRVAISASTTPGDADSVYRITQPGSYYLTGPVQGAAGKSGIEIAASHVTIDLGGFRLLGSAGTLAGVVETPGLAAIVVTNGAVHGWGLSGVDLRTAASCRIEGVTATSNGQYGVATGPGSLLTGSAAHQNGADGIRAGYSSVVRGCSATANTGYGIEGFSSVIESCSAKDNGRSGISVTNNSTVRGCAALANTESGFECYDDSQLLDCIADLNGLHGIDAGFAVQVSRCKADSNTQHGIRFGSYCTITDNSCRGNGYGAAGGAGVFMSAGFWHSRVSGNDCAQNKWGVRVEGTAALVIGNSCTLNSTSNFEIAAGNRVGAIVSLPLSGAISGSAGGSSAGADPVSNFAY